MCTVINKPDLGFPYLNKWRVSFGGGTFDTKTTPLLQPAFTVRVFAFK